jgi:hypothetical protein
VSQYNQPTQVQLDALKPGCEICHRPFRLGPPYWIGQAGCYDGHMYDWTSGQGIYYDDVCKCECHK